MERIEMLRLSIYSEYERNPNSARLIDISQQLDQLLNQHQRIKNTSIKR
ncbi:Spo0E family sporulation regulatory protein-aspartic acid phosphatase [Halobacillus ihumii]|nr:Spo0E family sporulation regulatory protein-aspartic acid phosphatase [Halobacillus ihumii]